MIFSTLFTAILFASASYAAPINIPQELIVFNPSIISPKETSTWALGSKQVVKWETKDIPSEEMNTTGVVLLGHMENNSENLDIEHPLATGFPINSGSVKVVIPGNIPARDDYFIVLFGDSGNKSPKFKIHY